MDGSSGVPMFPAGPLRRWGSAVLSMRCVNFISVLFLASIVLETAPCAAQRTLRGRVLTVDSVPVYRAVVRLRDPGDSTVTASVPTGEQGEFSFLLSGAEETPRAFPEAPSLIAYPNPSHGITRLRFQRTDRAFTRLLVMDMLGRRVATLVDETLEAGEYEIAWNGRGQGGETPAAGMYRAVLSDRHSAIACGVLFAGSGGSPVSAAPLRRTGAHAALGKTTSATNILLDVMDTTAALPRIVSKTGLSFHMLSDTSVTIVVEYGKMEDLDFPSRIETTPLFPGRMRLVDPWLYVCCGRYGLWKRNVETMSPWQFLGLSDTVSDSQHLWNNIVDVDADGDTILAASYPTYQGAPPDTLVSVWRSENGGSTWSRSDLGIVVGPHGDWNRVDLLRRSPADRRAVVATVWGAWYTSLDGGRSWKYIRGGRLALVQCYDIMWHPYVPGEFWLSFNNSGIEWRTFGYTHNGDSIKPGADFAWPIGTLAFSPEDPLVMYGAQTRFRMIRKSTDGGITWELFEAPGAIYFLREHPLRGDMLFEGMGTTVDLIRLPEYRRQVIVKQSGLEQGRFCIDGKGAFVYIGDGTRVYRLFVGDYN
jgi:hypothetical protein